MLELSGNLRILTLTPRYMTRQVKKLNKERYINIYLALYQKKVYQFHNSYITLNQKNNKTNMNLNKTQFDCFVLREMTQKCMERIFLVLSLMYPKIKETILLIEKHNDLPILL